jgi:hypothetical protein
MEINNTQPSLQIQNFGRPNQAPKKVNDPQEKSEQASSQQRVNRLEVSDNAISLLEQEKETSDRSTAYDQPSKKNATAVSTYQSVNNLEQRENVQQLLGVDIFA